MELCGRRFDTGQPTRLEIADGRIARVQFVAECDTTAAWPWIAPGLVDLQVNGYGGREFTSPSLTIEDVDAIAEAMLACGVTRFCPTVTTQAYAVQEHAMATIDAACRASPELARHLIGIHFEGPYISAQDGPRGAHPREHCRPPDWNEFQRLQAAAGGRIRLVTLSPEYAGAPEFIRRATDAGVLASIGHTAANGVQIRAAVDAGARLSTHLGNGSHGMLPRHPNYIWDQLAEDRLTATLIADGHHLPAEVVKSIIRAKTSERSILVSDLVAQAGLPPGRYRGSLCEVDVLPTGRLVVAGQTQMLAGASAPLGEGVAGAVHFAGVSLAEAVRMAAHRPAELLGLSVSALMPGDSAELLAFDIEPSLAGAGRAFRVHVALP